MKKKIAFFIESLAIGGAEKSLATLLKTYDFTQWEVTLFLLVDAGGFTADVPEFVKVRYISTPSFPFVQRVLYYIRKKTNKKIHPAHFFWKFFGRRYAAVEETFDIAVAYGQGFSTCFVADKMSAKIKYAWINTDYEKAGYRLTYDKTYYQKFKKIVLVSPEAHQSFKMACEKENLTIPTEIIKDITDIAYLKEQAAKPLPKPLPGEIKVVSVGRLVKSKGFDLAIAACKILVDKKYPVSWTVVGEGEERADLEASIKSNSLENYFRLVGADLNPYRYMKAADIYVQTSLFEGLGLTLIEAAHLEKPIVTTAFETAKTLLKENETALFAEMNPHSLAQKIELLINNPVLRSTLVSNLRKRENFDKEESLRKIGELLEEVYTTAPLIH